MQHTGGPPDTGRPDGLREDESRDDRSRDGRPDAPSLSDLLDEITALQATAVATGQRLTSLEARVASAPARTLSDIHAKLQLIRLRMTHIHLIPPDDPTLRLCTTALEGMAGLEGE